MMMSPDTYYEMYLKGKDEKQLLTAIRGLKKEIGHLKNVMEHPDYKNGLLMEPSEDVRISCNREYLFRAIQAYEELGGTYLPSRAEQKAIEFQNSLDYISKVTFEIGGFFDGMTSYTLEFKVDEVKCTSSRFDMSFEEMSMDKETILWLLSRLYIGEWKKYYDPKRFGYSVLDGTQWSVKFEYSNGNKSIEFAGSNDYPYNFSEFVNIFDVEDDAEYDEE